MGEVRDQLDGLQVRVESPDGRIRAITVGGRFRSLGFRPGCYRHYRNESELEHQLARLATLLFTAHSRGVREIKDRAGIRSYLDPALARDATERIYLERINSLTAVGAGPQDVVRLQTAGMTAWRCRIRPGSLEWLREDEFVAEASAAAVAVRTDVARQVVRIKDECFDLKREPLTASR